MACKTIMAVTGIIFSMFVLAHMVGNLKVYEGAETFNSYAHWLRTAFEPLLPYQGLLWILRFVLVLSLVGHVWCSFVVRARARRARGAFRRRGLGARVIGARTMLATGVVLLCFIAFHILDLTTGTRPMATGAYQAAGRSESFAYDNLIASFERPVASAFYLVAMVVLGLHLAHGLWSVVNDLGATGHRVRQVGAALAGGLGMLVFIGNATIPIAVLTGVLP